ncbi:hypothetical protein R1sor_020778 [Riccia sorocarpa]|uniref:Uncharacterized protein n=1 Tax=Riccia sorocarpa TaxID=122646 RepID=A0ABD3GF55_9MARC
MATSSISLTSAGSAVSSPVRDSSRLSSQSAFGTSVVQFAPVRRSLPTANRVVVVKANLSEDQPSTGKKVLASILAAGAALGIAGQALAGNPVDFAKSKAGEVVSSAQEATSSLPKPPKIELPNAGALQNAGKAAEGALQSVQGRMDGIFGKNKPYTQGRVASTNGGTGSAIGDAKKRIAQFPAKNAFAENLAGTTKDFEDSIPKATGENSGSARSAREFLGKDSSRVDAATKRVGELGEDFKNKAGDALDEAKGFVGSVQNATPDLPSPPELPSLPNPLEGVNKNMKDMKSKVGNVSGDLASKATEVKDNVASKASNATGGKADDAIKGVASKVDDVKGDVSSKISDVTNSSPNEVVKSAKDVVGSAQDAAKDATSNFPSLPNPLEGISKTFQGKTNDARERPSVEDVKGEANSVIGEGDKKFKAIADTANKAAGNAKDSADNASLKAPSALNVFGGIGKKVQGATSDVKDNVASTVDNVTSDVSSKASDLTKGVPGDAVNSAKNVAQDAASNLPSLPNPFEGLGKGAQGNAADAKNAVASKVDDVKEGVSSKASKLTNTSPGDVVEGAKDLVGSAQEAAPSLPSIPNPLEGLKGLTGNAAEKLTPDNVPNPSNLEDGLKAKAALK